MNDTFNKINTGKLLRPLPTEFGGYYPISSHIGVSKEGIEILDGDEFLNSL